VSAPHTPGRVCDACEGFCLQPATRVEAGVELSLRIGQQVRHRDYQGKRVTGVLRGLSFDSEGVLMGDIVLGAPIVIPPSEIGDREISIWRQHVPAQELAPFDDRDEAIDVLTALARRVARLNRDAGEIGAGMLASLIDDARAALAAAGSEA
jgi:hypothetical protein